MRGFNKMRTKTIGVLSTIAIVLSATVASASGPDSAPNHLRDVKIHADALVPGGTEIEVVGSGPPTFSVRVADGGTKLIVDLANADVMGAPEAITKGEGVVGTVLTQGFRTDAGTQARLVVSLAKQASYRLKADGNTLRLTLAPSEVTTSAATVDAPLPVDPAKAAAAAATTTAPAAIEAVRFERKGNKDRVVVAMNAIPAYAMTPGPSGRLRLELRSATLATARLAQSLDVSEMRGAVRTVSTFADGANGAIVEIDRAGDQQGVVTVEGNSLVWSFDRPANSSVAIGPGVVVGRSHSVTVERDEALAPMPRIQTGMYDDGRVETTGGSQAGFTSSLRAQEQRPYTGRRVDLDFQSADIHSILRLLADVGHVNIVTADDVAGSVTIRMNNVPWDQGLDVVLTAKGLGMVRTGNLIRVAPLAQLQKERELRIAQQRAELDLMPLEMRLIQISYAKAEEIQARAHELLSSRGSISVDERTNTIIARDIGGNLNRIEELIRSLDTQTPQVLIEARIVEATSNYLRDVGIQWGGDTTFSEATGNPTGIAFPSRVTAAGGASDGNTPTAGLSPFSSSVSQPNFAVNLPAAVGTGQGGALGLTFGSIDNNFNLNLRLTAAETSGLVRIVSSPRILTLNNKIARINQGTLIPFSQVSAQGVQTTFQEAKLQLLVTPHVTAEGSVSMHMKVNRDEPNFNQTAANGAPTILKREAETDLLVMDGHTAVIGGIFTRNTGRNLDQVPFFGDIPIIGILFQHRKANDTRNELVIFITPRIVNRAESIGH
jgi:type IV pilus assembly protein PilQ